MGNAVRYDVVQFFFYVHVTVHRNKFLFSKTNRRTNFPNLFLSRNSSCYEQFLCPSSGVFHCTFGTGIYHAGVMTAFKYDLVVLESCPCYSFLLEAESTPVLPEGLGQ
jgi:hypothetical protein